MGLQDEWKSGIKLKYSENVVVRDVGIKVGIASGRLLSGLLGTVSPHVGVLGPALQFAMSLSKACPPRFANIHDLYLLGTKLNGSVRCCYDIVSCLVAQYIFQ